MPHAHSVLAKARRADLRYDPFPHLVIENCLPEDYYRALEQSYPEDATILQLDAWRRRQRGQNQRADICAHQAFEHPELVAPVWLEFMRHHCSGAFYAEVIALLGPEMKTLYPDLERRLGGRLEDRTVGVRFQPGGDTGALSLDCQVGINTAVTRRSSVRGAHTDAPEELYAMLLYFRRADDDAPGGDLEILRWRDGVERRFVGTAVDDADCERVSTVPYAPNTLVVFLNAQHAVHAVSPREPTAKSRRLVNVIGEVYNAIPEGLYAKPQKPPAEPGQPPAAAPGGGLLGRYRQLVGRRKSAGTG